MVQVAAGGNLFNYVVIGHGQKTPLLILHGWGRDGREWVRMAEDLHAWSGRTVYVVDLPGFGGSSLPGVADIFAYTETVVALLTYLDIKRIILIGHSLGGRVGIVMGARHHSLVEKLILIDPAGVKIKSLKRVILKSAASFFRFLPTTLRRKTVARFMDEDYRSDPTRRDLYRAVVKDDLTHLLHEITCPTGVVWGERDPLVPLSQTKVYRRELVRPTIRVVWGAGHDPHLTAYDQLKTILEEMTE